MTIALTPRVPAGRYGLGQTIPAEVNKITSLRSSLWILLITVAGTATVTVLATNSDGHHDAQWYQGFDPTNQSLSGLAIAILAIGIFGALNVTGEFGSGTIRSSLAAAPRRPLFCATKMLVVGTASLVVGEVVTFGSFLIGQSVLQGVKAPTASLGHAQVLQALVLSGICVSLIALIGLGLGMIVRNTTGAVSAFVGVIFLLPIILNNISGHLRSYTPLGIMANSVSAVSEHGQLDPIRGFLYMILYTAVVLVAGTVLMVRRDA
jgi:ABC-2 type transport system permease protein